ncbi:hypothetical protein [Empedobacter falsenii]
MYSFIVTITALVLFVLLTGLITYVFYKSKYDKIKGIILSIIEHINTYLYLYLIPFPILYLCFYYFFFNNIEFNYQKEKLPFFYKPEVADFLKNLSIIFFSGGVFSATVKLINSLVIFKKQFKDIIISQEFKSVLSEELETIALSDNYLLKRADLEDVWKRVTMCKYEQKFPQLKNQLKNKLENEFFKEKNLNFYYKNFRTQINIEFLHSNIIKITEISNFTIIANSENKITMDFWISGSKTDNEIYTKYVSEKCKVDGIKLDIIEKDNEIEDDLFEIKKFEAYVDGSTEYEIERSVECTQHLDKDRVFTFNTERIIDGLTVKIKMCNKLKCFFSPVISNAFKVDNQNHEGNSYICREIILPGQSFQVFIFKTN